MRRRRNRKRKGCTRSDRRTVTQDLTLVKTYFYFCVCKKKFLDNILVITMDFHAAKHTCMLQIPVNSLTSLALVNHKNHLMGIKPSLHFTSPVLHVQSVLIPNTCKTVSSIILSYYFFNASEPYSL